MTAYQDFDEEEADDRDDEQPTVPCPHCRREILEDVPQCPYCEQYVSAEDYARQSKPLWVIVTAVVCLAISIWLAFAVF